MTLQSLPLSPSWDNDLVVLSPTGDLINEKGDSLNVVKANVNQLTGGIEFLTIGGVNSSIKPNSTPRAPIIEAVSWSGSAAPQLIELGYKPDLVITKAAGKNAAFFANEYWMSNRQGFGNLTVSGSDGQYGCAMHPRGLYVPGAVESNYAGSTHYALVIRDNGSGILKTWSYNGYRNKSNGAPDNQGNTSNTVSMDLIAGTNPNYVYIKRDAASANHEGVWCTPTWAKKDSAVAVDNALLTLASEGTLSLSTDVAVNENNAGVIGESHNCFSLHSEGTYWEDQSYVGTGAAFTIQCQRDVAGLIVIPQAAKAMEFWISGMGTSSADGGATALNTGRVYAIGSTVHIGADSSCNTSGTSYSLIVFYKIGTAPKIEVPYSPRSGVKLYTAGTSRIACGTDASLGIAGAHSLEWIGSIGGDYGSEQFIMGRIGNGATVGSRGTPLAASCNYAMSYSPSADCGLEICTSDQFSSEASAASKQKRWRTGIFLSPGETYHIVYTHDGTDKWILYVNGRPVKWRRLPMSIWPAAGGWSGSGIVNTAGLQMSFGGRIASGTWAGSYFTTHRFGRIYNRVLTAAEVLQMHAKHYLRSTSYASADLTDTGTALVEEWTFAESSGSTVAATKSAANNGTITTGVWVS